MDTEEPVIGCRDRITSHQFLRPDEGLSAAGYHPREDAHMAEHMNLYQQAVYYDVVFERNVDDEVTFLNEVCRKHCGRRPDSVLELACGPGYHARAFARSGVRAVGLDLGREMIRLAREKADREGINVEWQIGDMRDFDLRAPVDLAFSMFDGIDALARNDDLVQHLEAVAHNLTASGLYVIDLTHPRDCSHQDYGDYVYRGERDGLQVEIEWAVNDPAFDLVTGVAEVELEMRVNDHGRELVVRDTARERLLYPQEIRLLATLSGQLDVVGWYGDYSVEQTLAMEDPNARRMIAVLQRSA